MTSGKYVALNVFLAIAEGVRLALEDRVVDEESGEGAALLSLWLATRRDG